METYQWWKLWFLMVTIESKSKHHFTCSLEIPLSITKQNVAHAYIMGIMRPELKNLWFLEGNITG